MCYQALFGLQTSSVLFCSRNRNPQNPYRQSGSRSWVDSHWELRKFLFFRETLEFPRGRCWQGLGWWKGTRGRGGGELPRKRPGYSSSRFYRGEKLQISASLVVCRTESTINSSWEPRLLAIHTKVSLIGVLPWIISIKQTKHPLSNSVEYILNTRI